MELEQYGGKAFLSIVELDDAGYITTDDMMATSALGILAAYDIHGNSARQIATAVGDGATATMPAFRYLQRRS